MAAVFCSTDWKELAKNLSMVEFINGTGMTKMRNQKIYDEVDNRRKNLPFYRETGRIVQEANKKAASYGQPDCYDAKTFNENTIIFIGGTMELVNEELKLLNEEVLKSKEIIQKTWNDMKATSISVQSELDKEIISMRSARMTVIAEMQQVLTMLRDVRKFFLESDYEKEMKRLNEFINLCKMIEELKKNGTLDAIGETIINLSIGKEKR